MKKIIASDLDGTLLNTDSKISNINLSQITKLKQNGIAVVPVTGRTLFEIPKEIREHEDIEYIIYSNGAGIESKKEGCIYYTPIDAGFKKKLFRILSSFDTFIEIYSNGHVFVDSKKFNEDRFHYYGIDAYFIPVLYESREPIEHFSKIIQTDTYPVEMFDVFFHSLEERKACKEKILKAGYPVEITTSMTTNLEITNGFVNKGFTFQELCNRIGFDMQNTIAIGDSRNDLSLFRLVKNSFAVSNACAELKAIATDVICSNDEHVLDYLEKNIL